MTRNTSTESDRTDQQPTLEEVVKEARDRSYYVTTPLNTLACIYADDEHCEMIKVEDFPAGQQFLTYEVIEDEVTAYGAKMIISVITERGSEVVEIKQEVPDTAEKVVDKAERVFKNSEYMAIGEMKVIETEKSVVVKSEKGRDFGFVKLGEFGHEKENAVVFSDKDVDIGYRERMKESVGAKYHYPPEGNETYRVPDEVFELLAEEGYEVRKNVDTGWASWEGLPRWSEPYATGGESVRGD